MSSRFLSEDSKSVSIQLNLAVFAAGFATFINMWCTQPVLPQIAAAFHVSQAMTGLVVIAPLLATAMMAPVIGAISDRFGRKKLIVWASILLVIPSALAAGAASLNTLVLWRFAEGLMLPCIFTVTIAYIGDESAGAEMAKLAGTYMSGTIFGGFSGRLVSGFVTQSHGWRAGLLAVAAITLAMGILVAAALPKEKNFRPIYGIGKALRSFPLHFTNQRLLATYAVGFGVLFSLVAVFTYINFRLAAAPYFLGPAALGAIFTVYLGGVVMSPVAARLANRFGRQRVVAAAGLLVFAGLGATLAADPAVIVAGLLLVCSAIFVQQTLATAFIGVAATQAKSTAVGLYVTFYYIGGSFGGLTPAPAWHDYGWPGCVAIVCGIQTAMLFFHAAVLDYGKVMAFHPSRPGFVLTGKFTGFN